MTASPDITIIQRIQEELHDICQPLSALQCRLEMGQLGGTDEALRDAVCGSLEETRRLFEAVTRMRQALAREEAPPLRHSLGRTTQKKGTE